MRLRTENFRGKPTEPRVDQAYTQSINPNKIVNLIGHLKLKYK